MGTEITISLISCLFIGLSFLSPAEHHAEECARLHHHSVLNKQIHSLYSPL